MEGAAQVNGGKIMSWRVLVRCFILLLTLAGCVETAPPPPATPPVPTRAVPAAERRALVAEFAAVVERVGPVAERTCLEAARGRFRCDFVILVDDRPGQPPNAYQTLTRGGRPVIVFTLGLVAEARNEDELAFALGHEMAHHILRHIPRQIESATTGAFVLGTLVAVAGGRPEDVRAAQELGATIGARRYSKAHELEADALGARIALAAGYDPIRGARFFERLPDPGDRFLATHPANSERIATVRRAVRGAR